MSTDSVLTLSSSALAVGAENNGSQEEEASLTSNDGVESAPLPQDPDLEDGELEDGELEDKGDDIEPQSDDIPEPPDESEPRPVAFIPSLLDMRISPPRNGALVLKNLPRWAKRSGNHKRYPGCGEDDNDHDGDLSKIKKLRKRKFDDKKSKLYAGYVDHDRTEEDAENIESADIAWPGFGKLKSKTGRSPKKMKYHISACDSPPGIYDSPYDSPPGPYDSPSDDENDAEIAIPKKPTRHDGAGDGIATDVLRVSPVADESDQKSSVQPASALPGVVEGKTEDSEQKQPILIENSQSNRRWPMPSKQEPPVKPPITVALKKASVVAGANSPEHPPAPPKRRRLVDTPREERPLCRFYLESKCSKGNDCPFNHNCPVPKKSNSPPLKKPQLCRFYNNGNCAKGKECPFHHETWPCSRFHAGNCPDGDGCRFSHAELTDETRLLIEKIEEENTEELETHPPPKKKSLLGDYPNQQLLSMSSDKKKIPSLFDIQVAPPLTIQSTTSVPGGSTTSAAGITRPVMPIGFMPRMTQPQQSLLGPGPPLPPRMAVIRMIQMRMGFVPTVPFPGVPVMAGQHQFGVESSRLPAPNPMTETVDSVAKMQHSATEYPIKTSDSVSIVPLSSSHPLFTADAVSSNTLSSSVSSQSTESTSSSLGLSTAVVTASSDEMAASHQSAVIAGVDVNQLPPIQRELYLRLHQTTNSLQQQQPTASQQPAVTTATNVNTNKAMDTNHVPLVSTSSAPSTATASNVFKLLAQQPPPLSFARMPLAPVFDINQVLSAISHGVVQPAVSTSAGVDTGVNQQSGLSSSTTAATDCELEVNGCRAQIEYSVKPFEAGGTIIPAHVDINDARWDEDPRVQRWRREIELGRMPQREIPKIAHGGAEPAKKTQFELTRPKRDPRLKSDGVDVSATAAQVQNDQQFQLQLQQQQIHELVQQLMQQSSHQPLQNSAHLTPMFAASQMPPSNVHRPTVNVNVSNQNLSGFIPSIDVHGNPSLYPHPSAAAPINFPLGMGRPNSALCPAVSIPSQPFMPFRAPIAPAAFARPSLVPTREQDAPVVTTAVHSTMSSSSSVFSAPASPPSANITNSESFQAQHTSPVPEVSSNNVAVTSASIEAVKPAEQPKASIEPKVDYRNDPRFRKRKTGPYVADSEKSLAASDSSKLVSSDDSKTLPECDRDPLEFQSPLAATEVRPSSASSGYNRPPNKRFQELMEQRDRRGNFGTCSDVSKKTVPANSSGASFAVPHLSDTATMISTVGLYASQDLLTAGSQAEGSLKDMFKTIDPTASPFC